ncbi:MAG: SprT-like domain-containing protein, partial [Verrucomicrobiota bacterium]|nr:SprT-like domain-containing protein [Verrucomicrobiota bacterium]
MLRFEQLDFTFALRGLLRAAPPAVAAEAESFPSVRPQDAKRTASPLRGRDAELEEVARELLRNANAAAMVEGVRVEWRPRLRTAAGRASYRHTLVSLNPRLQPHGSAEIDRT